LENNIQNQGEGHCRGPLTTLKGMVPIPRKLNMNHLRFHVISDSGKKMEMNGINAPDGAKRR